MDYSITNLSEYLEAFGEENYNKLVADFFCVKDPEIESYIKRTALDHNNKALSRTYLLISDDNKLLAFFTLALKSLDLAEQVSPTQRKKLTGSQTNDMKHIPTFLIGQLGKNSAIAKKDSVSGKELLQIAINTIRRAYNLVGGRMILVECSQTEFLIRFYETHGFVRYNIDHTDGLLRYIQKIS